ncbi:heterogeneous nuclear ribonucleoprotein A/B isoform X1 [Hydra vulgaris]|uniref:Heterogeneous nuclear ribonucleoprotein A/B isoform X2 n=1 Tax=Hydra vulgaris TaxID=6087 RepID=T2MCZ2_HYDVU|nr:heterogeneous nuclear ribonucleoprotein A/B-like [Hydra vulgaris]
MAGYNTEYNNTNNTTFSRPNMSYPVPPSSDNNEGKLFVGGLAWDTTEESLRNYFEKFGEVESVNLKRNKEDLNKHRGFAFVKFVTQESADEVLNQAEPHILDGSKIDPKSACPMGVKPEQRTKKIFVGGLQTETTEEKLREYFSQFGEIKNNIEFAVDHNTKKRRGFCFIEFANESVVDKIVKDKFHEIAGRRLETKRALSKQQQEEMKDAGLLGSRYRGGNPAIPGYPGMSVPPYPSPYAQPVIYIHPDSLSTAYPSAALGGISGMTGAYPHLQGGYTQSPMESLYTPYGGRDVRHGQPARGTVPSAYAKRPEPYPRKF